MAKNTECTTGEGGCAYLLMTTQPGKALSVVKALQKLKGVCHADAVTGPYDIIACVEAKDLDALGKFVVSKVQNVKGVKRTLTCLAVDA